MVERERNSPEKTNLHLLITISSDTENLFGVRFICSFFREPQHTDITLFHICRLDSSDANTALTAMWQEPDERILGSLTVGARRALDRASEILNGQHIPIHQMKTKTVEERYGKVKDILLESANGLYDAIVLGRRATYALQWFFDRPADEIPNALLKDTALACPLWVCCEPEEGRENVLLCVDGSASALRAADHVGYILSMAKQHSVTVFNVVTGPANDTEAILQDAVNVLLQHSIESERILCKSAWGLSVANTILNEKSSGRYAAVAVGLQGTSSSGILAGLGLAGGTTTALLKKVVKAALWCCP